MTFFILFSRLEVHFWCWLYKQLLLIAEFYFLVWLYRDVFTHSQVNKQAFPDLAILSKGSNIWFVFQHWTDMGIFLANYLGEGGVLRDTDFWVMQSEWWMALQSDSATLQYVGVGSASSELQHLVYHSSEFQFIR